LKVGRPAGRAHDPRDRRDDHALMRRSLRMVLEGEEGVRVVAEAGELPAVIRRVRGHRPDVLVLDLKMPNGSRIDAIRSLREQVPGTEIVVVTMLGSAAFVQQALDAGALGFVLKDTLDAGRPAGRAARALRQSARRRSFTPARRVAGAASAGPRATRRPDPELTRSRRRVPAPATRPG
jgi:two-component system response regulator NreC